MTYNGSAYTLSAILSNVVGDETIALEYVNNANVHAGEYTTEVSVPASVVNYQMATASVEYQIEQLKVEIGWDYVSAFTYDGAQKTVNAIVVNKVVGDIVTFEGAKQKSEIEILAISKNKAE